MALGHVRLIVMGESGTVPPTPTHLAAQRLLDGARGKSEFVAAFDVADVRLVAEAVMEQEARLRRALEISAAGGEVHACSRCGEINTVCDDCPRAPAPDLPACDNPECTREDHLNGWKNARREAVLQAEVVRLREALEGLVGAVWFLPTPARAERIAKAWDAARAALKGDA